MTIRPCKECKHHADDCCKQEQVATTYSWMRIGAAHVSCQRERCNIFGFCGPEGHKWEAKDAE